MNRTVLVTIAAFSFALFAFIPKTINTNISAPESEALSMRNPRNQCLSNSVEILTNGSQWSVEDNSYGILPGSRAEEVSYQYNTVPNHPNAKWISHTSNWTLFTNATDPDDSVTFRYKFSVCQPDIVTLNMIVKRDNYCTIYVNGSPIFQDPVVWHPNTYDAGHHIEFKYPSGAKREQIIDIVVYNRNAYTGNNGFGLQVGGYITSVNNSLFAPAAESSSISCCEQASVSRTQNSLAQLTVYPNPTNQGIVFIECPSSVVGKQYKIIDMSGKILLQGKFEAKKISISTSNLASGHYTIIADDCAPKRFSVQ